MSITLLGFDCADKSLGIVCISVDVNVMRECSTLTTHLHQLMAIDTIGAIDINSQISGIGSIVDNLKKIADNFVTIHYASVVDIIPDHKLKDTTIQDRMAGLRIAIEQLDNILSTLQCKPDIVCVEYQMSANDKSREVYHALVYHYIRDIPVYIVPPSVKLTFAFCGASYDSIVSGYMDKYKANKAHAIANMLNIFRICKLDPCIVLKNVKKSQWKDVADALINCFSYLKQVKKIILD